MTDVVAIPVTSLSAPDRLGGRRLGGCVVGVPIWKADKLIALNPTDAVPTRLLLPKLTEPHVHLDKCYSAHRMGAVGGDLASAIAAQRADKQNWTIEDLSDRAARGLDAARRAGCQTIRSHVDWGDTSDPPLAWTAIGDLNAPDLQRAALTGVEQMADSDFARTVAGHVARDGGVLGCFLLNQDITKMRRALTHIFAEAQRFDIMLDFHVDEGHGAHNGLEMIANMALETGFDRPILCGHAVSLMDRTPLEFARIADKLGQAGITVCALPSTNLYLQGRTAGTPERRGLTRLRELRAAGVPICLGSDNVQDAFCPTGAHDPMASLNLAILGAHLDPPLGRWLPLITTNPAQALGVIPDYVDDTPAGDLLIADTGVLADVIAGQARVRPLTSADILDKETTA